MYTKVQIPDVPTLSTFFPYSNLQITYIHTCEHMFKKRHPLKIHFI